MIRNQTIARHKSADNVHIKVNLFRGYEVEPFCAALDTARNSYRIKLDAVMLADSYLTTHLAYKSTRIDDVHLQEFFFRVLLSTIVEVRRALERSGIADKIYLIFDMPYGSAIHVDTGLQNVKRALAHGADAIKIEVSSLDHLALIEELATSEIPVLAHLGYSPQIGGPKFGARTASEARALFRDARRCRDAGAAALVLEGVSTPALAALAAESATGLPVYAIFSGHAPYAGQSINVWDTIYRPLFPARHFPPTAKFDIDSFPSTYTDQAITDHCRHLIELLAQGYPTFRPSDMSKSELNEIANFDPWVA